MDWKRRGVRNSRNHVTEPENQGRITQESLRIVQESLRIAQESPD